MKALKNAIITFLFLGFLNFSEVEEDTSIPVVNFKQLEPELHKKNDTVYLVNFWATWCSPCRDELPAIEQVREKYKEEKFRILLVSMDMPKQLNSRLVPFIKSNQIKSDVILLDDPHQNEWIDKVDPGWSGEIPFTVIYGRDFRNTYNKSFSFKELDTIIHAKLNSQ
ncbi:MAG TPA: redoxin domain-containing protein [Bacteroidales bacterium]|nr:redoxin domain-containing protein [Bacteroidales bacterium]